MVNSIEKLERVKKKSEPMQTDSWTDAEYSNHDDAMNRQCLLGTIEFSVGIDRFMLFAKRIIQ